VLHVPGFSFDGLCGYSPAKVLARSLGLTIATTDFGARFFGSGANMGGVLTHPGVLSKEAKSQAQDQIHELITVGNPQCLQVDGCLRRA
jgi:phage portal protein BeeE